jgi:hypothetical protein
MRALGVPVAVSDAFAVGEPGEAVRVCLGGAASRAEVQHALELMADALQAQGGASAFF